MIATYLFGHEHQISSLDKLPPNEFGDFLAGVFAPLAFAWLVVGVLVQKEELSQQLREFQHSVGQQIAHNRLVEEQLDRNRLKDLATSIMVDVRAFLSDVIFSSGELKIAYCRKEEKSDITVDDREWRVTQQGHRLFGDEAIVRKYLETDNLPEAFKHLRDRLRSSLLDFDRETTVPLFSDSFDVHLGALRDELSRILRRVEGVHDAELNSVLRSIRLRELRDDVARVEKRSLESH